MLPLLAASAIMAGVSAAGKGALAFKQLQDAKKLEEGNVRPEYEVQDEYLRNQRLAQSYAQSGFTDATKEYFTNNLDRGLQASIDATLQGGGNVNAVNGVFDTYGRELQGFGAKDSEVQAQRLGTLMERNVDVAGQKTMKWALNEYEPYKQVADAAARERDAGINNLFGALDSGSSALSSISTAGNYADLLGMGKSTTEDNRSRPSGEIVNPDQPGSSSRIPDPNNRNLPSGPSGTNPATSASSLYDQNRPLTLEELVRLYNSTRR